MPDPMGQIEFRRSSFAYMVYFCTGRSRLSRNLPVASRARHSIWLADGNRPESIDSGAPMPQALATPRFHLPLAAMLLTLLSGPVSAKETFELMTLTDQSGVTSSGLYNSDRPAMSSDGRFVTFRSDADDLVAAATGQFHIFLRDSQSGTTELISAAADGTEGNAGSENSDVSDNGCRVVFESNASNLVGDDTNGRQDIFLRDRCAEPPSLRRISKLTDGSQTSAQNFDPDITPDGRWVVYQNDDLGVVRYDVLNDTLVALTGDQKTGSHPSISDDGSRVAFYSSVPLIPADTNGVWDIYLWDAADGLSLASTGADGTARDQGDESSSRVVEPAISGDGRYVSFSTTASNLVANDTGDHQDVFVKDTQGGALIRTSVTGTGQQGNGDSPTEQGGRAALSRDGTWVAFQTIAMNLTGAEKSGNSGTVIHNIHTGETLALHAAGNFSDGIRPAISNDTYGRFVAFFSASSLDSRHSSSGVFRFDRHQLPVAVAKIDAATVQPIAANDTVTLDGSASNNEPNAKYFLPKPTPDLSYRWSQTSGPETVTLSSATTVKPTFTPTQDGNYTFQLVVNDTEEDSAPSTVVVTVGSVSNQKPLANAGADQTGIAVGATVTLDGSGSSDPDGHSLSHAWIQLFGPETDLVGANTASPSFQPAAAGTYIFQLVVNDGTTNSDPAFVSIDVAGSPSGSGLSADPGTNGTGFLGVAYRLDGRGSKDLDSGKSKGLRYLWTIESMPDHPLTGTPAVFKLVGAHSARPRFVPPLPGTYVFALRVVKGGVTSPASLVSVQVGGSILVDAPAKDEVWTTGLQTPVTVRWNYDGFSPKQKFFVALISSAAPCSGACLLKKGIKAGAASSQEIQVTLAGRKAQQLAGQSAVVLVCAPKIGHNEPVCGQSGTITLQGGE
ncbi:MAG: hypothetical protein FIA97_12940 [Methylococcaceae bacterium]|nr:hypothetical protein [Methylococcaceae bacterium]